MQKVAKELATEAVDATRLAQILLLVKENQLLTAAGLFILWQTGVLLTVSTEVGGAICG